MTRLLRVAAAAALLLLTGCGDGDSDRAPDPTARASASGVTVSVRLLAGSGDQRLLQATFTPDQPGFHLYSIDLPAQGIDGLGIPTRLTVRGDLTPAGGPTANRTTRLLRPDGLDTDLPVYPDGPVVFTLPVRQTGAHRAEVVVSYGACSEARCLMPVTDEVIGLPLG